jgi:hypothetical protein
MKRSSHQLFCLTALLLVTSLSNAAIVPTSATRQVYGGGTTVTPSSPYAEFEATVGSNYQYSSIAANEIIFDGVAVNGNSRFGIQFTVTETKDYGFDWNYRHSINSPDAFAYAAGGYEVSIFRNGLDVGKVYNMSCCQSPKPWDGSGSGKSIIQYQAGDTGMISFEAQSQDAIYSVGVNAHFAEVTSVPVPASLPLLGSAIASLLLGRKIKSGRSRKVLP